MVSLKSSSSFTWNPADYHPHNMASVDVAVTRAGKTGVYQCCIDEFLKMYPADSDSSVHIGMVRLDVVAKKSKIPTARLRNL
jgi:hypothetical protein